MSERAFDIVLYGASGYTGRLVAAYLAEVSRKVPIRWALAGRSVSKLEWVKAEIATIWPEAASLPVFAASTEEPDSIGRLARSARVVLTTVGPYSIHGEPVVEACIREGADYVDVTGEPRFVNGILERYGEAARKAGVRIVNCAGFDSVPHDLGALFTVERLPRGEPINVEAFVRTQKALVSGGTFQTALNEFGNFSSAREKPWAREPLPDGRQVEELESKIHQEPDLGGISCPMPTIDPQIVLRSARALDVYGPHFRYSHNVIVPSASALASGAIAIGGALALAQFGPTRALLSRFRRAGDGPPPNERALSFFQVTFRGKSTTRSVLTRVSGGDPYGETARMSSEAALCLVFDKDRLPPHVGVLTPAVAMGDLLIARLQAAGIRFELLEG